jgi:hypothetical protein
MERKVVARIDNIARGRIRRLLQRLDWKERRNRNDLRNLLLRLLILLRLARLRGRSLPVPER